MSVSLKTTPVSIFHKGLDNSENYRIPSLIRTQKGTLIASCDSRRDKDGDNPNNIDKVVRRSTDNGETWEDIQVIVDFPGYSWDGAAACDPAMLEDKETGTIWMIYNHTPGGIGLVLSEPGVGFNEKGERLLYDRNKEVCVLAKDGIVYKNGEKTDFSVKENGDVYFDDSRLVGNIYLVTGPLLEAKTSFIQAVKSDDDGLTWSSPIELNPFVKEEWMRFIGAGPGIGIQLEKGEKKGRIIFPIYYSNEPKAWRMSCCAIYSDDHGVTWKRGESPNDFRTIDGKEVHSKTLEKEEDMLTESQIIEHDDGTLEVFMRNHSGNYCIARAISTDAGETWGEVVFDEELIEPICQPAIIKYSDLGDGKERLLFANAASKNSRTNGTVRLSEDGGKTWAYSKVLEEGSFIYSSLVELPNNEVGILYESEFYKPYYDVKLYFTKFNLDWIKE